jgi:hypothetical protein
MAATSYEAARRMAESLTRAEQLRLIEELAGRSGGAESVSILELCGLGQEIWQGIDAQEYVMRERASWNG